MKKKLIALLLCLVLVASVAIPGTLAVGLDTAESTSEMSVTASAETASVFFGQEYASTLSVPVDGKSVLSVGCTADILGAQWQIYAPMAGVWANIYGETGSSCAVSYAMIRSMLDGDGLAKIRCLVSVADGTAVTQEVSLGVDTSAAPAQNEAPAAEPPVILSDTVVTPNTAEAPAVAAAPAMFSLPQNDEPSGDEPAGEEPAGDEPADDADVAPAADNPQPLAEDDPQTFTILIKYVFQDGTDAAPSWTATVAKGSDYSLNVASPDVLGYAPDAASVIEELKDIQSDITRTVTYYPAQVDFTVNHYQQNVEGSDYSLFASETIRDKVTNSQVGTGLAKNYDGFFALIYDSTITVAADGSTVVNIYYDRYYYLLNFDLAGGYGVEPVYARYGAPITVDTSALEKPGYEFAGWSPALPDVMPLNGGQYRANWNPVENVPFTVAFWYENANDGGYSYVGYVEKQAKPGTQVNSAAYQSEAFTGRDDTHFSYNSAKAETVTVAGDGSTILNVYFTRKTYTLTFQENVLSCGRDIHEHGSECCSKTGLHRHLGWNCNSDKCPYGYEHSAHTDDCYTMKTLETKTFRWQQNIEDYWNSGAGTKAPGKRWSHNDPSSPAGQKIFANPGNAIVHMTVMPDTDIIFTYRGDDATLHTIHIMLQNIDATSTAKDQYKEKYSYQVNVNGVYDKEEYTDREGFTKNYNNSDVKENGSSKGDKEHNVYLYYDRNSYTLQFYNKTGYVDDKETKIKYEAPLSGYNFIPGYPASTQEGAYEFAGWYTSEVCADGTEVNWDSATMPAKDIVLYAKWVPKSHTVTVRNDKDGAVVGKYTATHGSTVQNAPANPTKDGYKFVAWFYMENGVEKAYSFDIPVTKDLDLYAKWVSDKLAKGVIRYAVKNADGTETGIADPTYTSSLAGTTKTYYAKGGDQLYESYREGFFPKTSSHNIDFSADDAQNNYTFYYYEKESIDYTVRYLEQGTGKVLAEEKTGSSKSAVITETFVTVKGYRPDAYQKRLVLSVNGENVLTFWYVVDTEHAPVQAVHYIQNITGDGYTEYQSSVDLNGVIGQPYSEPEKSIPGFTYNSEKSKNDGVLTAGGLLLELYYDRIEYPYEFRFLEQGTNKTLATSDTGKARYQAQVVGDAKTIAGYELVQGGTQQTINIAIEEETAAEKNVRTFYYREKEVTINYVAVANGSVSPTSETIGVCTGNPKGSVPTPDENYRFDGWFKNQACTQPVDASWVDSSGKLTPQKNNSGLFEAATYYAKFTRKTASLTITKSVANANDSFIFDVVGDEGSRFTVSVGGNGSVTIAGLPVGETFKVTERNDWSWRYSADSPSVTIQAEGSSVTVTNTVNKSYLLDGSDYKQNNAAKYNSAAGN